MCGIAGAVDRAGRYDLADLRDRTARMAARMGHRGPDDDGVWSAAPCALAHRRLAVIDLDHRAAQPMRLPDDRLAVIYNGEIYNYAELRAELERAGCVFRTEGDTEVLLWGWRVWGAAMVPRLRGMFAFALWDAGSGSLVLVRDRLGKKPLFYAEQDGAFLFASEVQALFGWPGFRREVDLDVIHDFLTFHYCIGPNAAFRGVRKLPPAHMLTLRPERAPLLERYWAPPAIDDALGSRSHQDLALELVDRLDDAVRCRLVADVPVGAFLSGGVDSSAVVVRMAHLSSRPIKTFSAGFADADFDESGHARQVADLFATDHQEVRIGHGVAADLPRLVWHFGEPYADSSALATFALARSVRDQVTVALTGDGADETFLGYARYLRFQSLVERWHDGARPPLAAAPLPLAGGSPHLRDHYVRWLSSFREEHKQAGYGPALRDRLMLAPSDTLGTRLERADPTNAIDGAARGELGTYLPDDLNAKVDIASMAASLECRAPFLDHLLVEWAMRLPQHRRVFARDGALESKALLKLAMEPYLPAALLYRRKHGFSVPVRHWLRHELKDLVRDVLCSPAFRARGLFRPGFVETMIDRHMRGVEEHGHRIWTLLCLELWWRTFIDGTGEAPLDLGMTAPAVSG
jgi:asparagine synthase (glutamine-hydrolysing)